MAASLTGLVYDGRFTEHDTGLALVSATVPADSISEPQPHAASPQLDARTYRLLGRSGLLDALVEIPARPATIPEVTRVHTAAHLGHLRRDGGGEAGEYAPASPETYDVALLAAGADEARGRAPGAVGRTAGGAAAPDRLP